MTTIGNGIIRGVTAGLVAAVAAVAAFGTDSLGIRLRGLPARRLGSGLPGAFIEGAFGASLVWLSTRRS